jgi:hypothetical protein
MTAEEILIGLRPLLSSPKLQDLLKAKEALFTAKENLKGADRERISQEIASLQESIEIAMDIDYSNLPADEDDDIPTLGPDGTWKNAEHLKP